MTYEQRQPYSHAGRVWAGQGSVTNFAGATTVSTGLIGPLPLRYESVRDAITRTAAGAYALGYAANDGGFCVLQIGRSDTDVRSKLIGQIGTQNLFKFILSTGPMLAFEKECELFHNFSPPNNRRHPERTAGTNWTCPRCRQFGW